MAVGGDANRVTARVAARLTDPLPVAVGHRSRPAADELGWHLRAGARRSGNGSDRKSRKERRAREPRADATPPARPLSRRGESPERLPATIVRNSMAGSVRSRPSACRLRRTGFGLANPRIAGNPNPMKEDLGEQTLLVAKPEPRRPVLLYVGLDLCRKRLDFDALLSERRALRAGRCPSGCRWFGRAGAAIGRCERAGVWR